MAEKRKPRVIKRYANRKLYDMSESCYITHDEIANLVESGEEVKIIDNKTKEDLTTRTLTQILFEKEKKNRRTLPLSTLRGLFVSGGDFIQKHITDPVNVRLEEAGGRVRKVFKKPASRDEETPAEAKATDAPSSVGRAGPELAAGEDAAKSKGVESLREWLDNSQKAVENMQTTLEERWNLIVNSIGHFDINHRRISELERRVAELEERLAAAEGEPAEQRGKE